MSVMSKNKELAVGYGYLDMRKGELLTSVYGKLTTMFEKQPNIKSYYFDVIHYPDQTPQAMAWQEEIRYMIHEVTDLKGDKINVRLSFHEGKLNARNDLYKTIHERNIKSVQERNVG